MARDHNIDPSSISRTIASLEKELGVRLFQRTTRQHSLTEAGMVYYERVEPLIDEMVGAITAAQEISGQPKGTLRITASVSFGLTCVVPHLPEFEAAYPDLSVDLVLSNSVLDLVSERIDVAIRLGMMADSTLIAHQLMQTRYFVCASPQYLKQHGNPRQPQDLSQHECLRFPLGGFRSRWRFRNEQGEIEDVEIQGRIVISSAIALRECALSHMGLSLLPHWLIQADLETHRLINVFPNHAVTATTFETAAWFVYPSKSYLPLKVKVFIDFLRGQLTPSEQFRLL